MRAKQGFNLRTVCGEKIVVAEGKENIDFSNIISMNESSAYLWENVKGKEFDEHTLVTLLTDAYEVDEHTALEDSRGLIAQWKEQGIIED